MADGRKPARGPAPLTERPAVFIDTGAWYATLNPKDSRHGQAVPRMREILGSARIFTSDYVFCELVTLARARMGFPFAREVGEVLRAHGRLPMLEVTPRNPPLCG